MESPFSPSIYCSSSPSLTSLLLLQVGLAAISISVPSKSASESKRERANVGLCPAVRTKGPISLNVSFARKIGKVQVLSAYRRRNVSLSFSLSVLSFHSRSNATLPPPRPPHHYASHQRGRGSQEGLGPTSIDLSQDNLRNFWLVRNSPN